jgi:hypothetical protein
MPSLNGSRRRRWSVLGVAAVLVVAIAIPALAAFQSGTKGCPQEDAFSWIDYNTKGTPRWIKAPGMGTPTSEGASATHFTNGTRQGALYGGSWSIEAAEINTGLTNPHCTNWGE